MKKRHKGTIMVENSKIEALAWDTEKLSKMLEEALNSTEEMGKRTPGERCMYEIQRKINVEENKRRVERIKREDDGY